MTVDIEKAREWWKVNGGEVYGPQATELATDYLDELEAARELLQNAHNAGNALARDLVSSEEENKKLRALLHDQRAHSIRMLAVEAYGIGSTLSERDVERVAEAYDRICALPVPPPAEKVGES